MCVGGEQQAYAWWTDSANGFIAQIVFLVEPGDVIDAAVAQDAVGDWTYSLDDLTSGKSSSAAEPFDAVGTTAEWIVEDPAEQGQDLYPLPNFDPIVFSDLNVIDQGVPWVPPSFSNAIEMVTSSGFVEAVPSEIQVFGISGSFTVSHGIQPDPGFGKSTKRMPKPRIASIQRPLLHVTPRAP